MDRAEISAAATTTGDPPIAKPDEENYTKDYNEENEKRIHSIIVTVIAVTIHWLFGGQSLLLAVASGLAIHWALTYSEPRRGGMIPGSETPVLSSEGKVAADEVQPQQKPMAMPLFPVQELLMLAQESEKIINAKGGIGGRGEQMDARSSTNRLLTNCQKMISIITSADNFYEGAAWSVLKAPDLDHSARQYLELYSGQPAAADLQAATGGVVAVGSNRHRSANSWAALNQEEDASGNSENIRARSVPGRCRRSSVPPSLQPRKTGTIVRAARSCRLPRRLANDLDSLSASGDEKAEEVEERVLRPVPLLSPRRTLRPMMSNLSGGRTRTSTQSSCSLRRRLLSQQLSSLPTRPQLVSLSSVAVTVPTTATMVIDAGLERLNDLPVAENEDDPWNLVSVVGKKWDFDILELSDRCQHVFVEFGWTLLMNDVCGKKDKNSPCSGLNRLASAPLNVEQETLLNFLTAIADLYQFTPYHNELHGANVGHAAIYLIDKLGILSTMSSRERVTVTVAALCHDVGHPGRNNSFFVNSYDQLAIIYNDQAVLENLHAYTTFKTLDRQECDIFEHLSENEFRATRQSIVELILATDMKQHFEAVTRLKVKTSSPDFDFINRGEDQALVVRMCMKLADLGHAAVPWDSHFEWSCRITEEFYDQGDEELELCLAVSPLCDRSKHREFPKSQVGFLDFVVRPLAVELAALDQTQAVRHELLDQLTSNCEVWRLAASEIHNCNVEWPHRLKRMVQEINHRKQLLLTGDISGDSTQNTDDDEENDEESGEFNMPPQTEDDKCWDCPNKLTVEINSSSSNSWSGSKSLEDAVESAALWISSNRVNQPTTPLLATAAEATVADASDSPPLFRRSSSLPRVPRNWRESPFTRIYRKADDGVAVLQVGGMGNSQKDQDD